MSRRILLMVLGWTFFAEQSDQRSSASNSDATRQYWRCPPLSLSLPKRIEAYEAESLFPFFTNLLPEGANRKVVCREKRIDENDFFGMLMATVGTDMIGSVNFKEVENG